MQACCRNGKGTNIFSAPILYQANQVNWSQPLAVPCSDIHPYPPQKVLSHKPDMPRILFMCSLSVSPLWSGKLLKGKQAGS